MTLTTDERAQSRDALLREIRDLQEDFTARKRWMVVLAQDTGRTSLVNTVKGIETVLRQAYEKVERS